MHDSESRPCILHYVIKTNEINRYVDKSSSSVAGKHVEEFRFDRKHL